MNTVASHCSTEAIPSHGPLSTTLNAAGALVTPPEDATIDATPTPAPVASPSASMVPTAGGSEVQTRIGAATGRPPASRATTL